MKDYLLRIRPPEWADGVLVKVKPIMAGRNHVEAMPVRRSKYHEGWYLKDGWHPVDIPSEIKGVLKSAELEEGFTVVVTSDGKLVAVLTSMWGANVNVYPLKITVEEKKEQVTAGA